MAIEFTDANFDAEVLASDTPVLVDFSATWCQPCKLLSPIIDELAKEYAGKIKIGKADLDESPEAAAKFQVMAVPTVLYFKNGAEVDRDQGVQSKALYRKKLDKLV